MNADKGRKDGASLLPSCLFLRSSAFICGSFSSKNPIFPVASPLLDDNMYIRTLTRPNLSFRSQLEGPVHETDQPHPRRRGHEARPPRPAAVPHLRRRAGLARPVRPLPPLRLLRLRLLRGAARRGGGLPVNQEPARN